MFSLHTSGIHRFFLGLLFKTLMFSFNKYWLSTSESSRDLETVESLTTACRESANLLGFPINTQIQGSPSLALNPPHPTLGGSENPRINPTNPIREADPGVLVMIWAWERCRWWLKHTLALPSCCESAGMFSDVKSRNTHTRTTQTPLFFETVFFLSPNGI